MSFPGVPFYVNPLQFLFFCILLNTFQCLDDLQELFLLLTEVKVLLVLVIPSISKFLQKGCFLLTPLCLCVTFQVDSSIFSLLLQKIPHSILFFRDLFRFQFVCDTFIVKSELTDFLISWISSRTRFSEEIVKFELGRGCSIGKDQNIVQKNPIVFDLWADAVNLTCNNLSSRNKFFVDHFFGIKENKP